MKKLLLMAALLFSVVTFGQFANIGILGSSTPAGWETDLDMTTTDGVIYTYSGLVINVPASDPGVKFRQDDAWTVNWGGTGFPAGTASLNGSNIPAVNGTYDVTFNLNTLQYSFVASGFATIALQGDGVNVTLVTVDGINYVANNVSLPGTEVAFYLNGVLVAGSQESPEANSYNITYNAQTGEVNFDFVTISLIGLGVVTEDPGWVTDVDMETEDGVNYTLSNYAFPGGEGKFRLNHEWGMAWGSADFPSGTASSAGDAPNLNIVAGSFDVTFNRESGEFNFAAVTNSMANFTAGSFVVYPNPAQDGWNFSGKAIIDSVQITDVTGKVVYTAKANADHITVNAEGFSSGIYFAKLQNGGAVQTIKLIKK